MKLPIKKKYFDLIKAGKKTAEFRDAHITFVCEETNEVLVRNVVSAKVIPNPGGMDDVLEGENVIRFDFVPTYY